jgi:hypothetical protein
MGYNLHFNDSCIGRVDLEIGLESLEVLSVEGLAHLIVSPIAGKEILTGLLSLLLV